ncbi:MAG: hypothetical protein N4A49_15940 [Marinifilaceae bacterium]|jgi:hypothetical protein|nr:hypothetical protein [Marinifilaceae bacterium]
MKNISLTISIIICLLTFSHLGFSQKTRIKNPNRTVLSQDQKDKLKELELQYYNDTKDYKTELEKIKYEIKIWQIQNGFYNDNIVRLINQKAELNKKLAEKRINHKFERRDIINKEQKEQMRDIMRNKHNNSARHSNSRGHHQNGNKHIHKHNNKNHNYAEFLELDANQKLLFEKKFTELKAFNEKLRVEKKANRENFRAQKELNKEEALKMMISRIESEKERALFTLNILKEIEPSLSKRQKELYQAKRHKPFGLKKQFRKMRKNKMQNP